MEVKLRYATKDTSSSCFVTHTLKYETDSSEQYRVGERITLIPELGCDSVVNDRVVVEIDRITHVKIVPQTTIRQKPLIPDLRLVIRVRPIYDEVVSRYVIYTNHQLESIGFVRI